MEIPLTTDGWIAFDLDGYYLTLFLDEPSLDINGHWFAFDTNRILTIKEIRNPNIVFNAKGNLIHAGEKIKFIGLEFQA